MRRRQKETHAKRHRRDRMTTGTTSALLIMDIQDATVALLGKDAEGYLATLNRVAESARAARIPVIYVRIGFRKGAPEMSPRNRLSERVGSDTFYESGPAAQIRQAVAPHDDDIIVTKRRVSAFSGSDLDVVLRSLQVDSLVLTGIATSGVVLSTLRQAADLDFRLTVLSDGCADSDPEIHRLLTEKVFPRQASVITAREWIESLDTAPGPRHP
jgi:nicotinamidase-related amidase